MRYHGDLLFKIVKGLTANAQFVYETDHRTNDWYANQESQAAKVIYNAYTEIDPMGNVTHITPAAGGFRAARNLDGRYWTARGQLNYAGTFGRHEIVALAGLEFRETLYAGTSALMLGYDDQLQNASTQTIDLATISQMRYSSNYMALGGGFPALQFAYTPYIANNMSPVVEQHHRYASGYANFTYTYDEKYNVFGSFRKDYADVYGLNVKLRGRPLWSAGVAWNINNENFMKGVSWINALKLRLSYGVTGNMPGSSYLYMMLVGPGSDYIFSDGKFILPWGPQTNVNEYIRWEEKRETNVGLDYAMLDGRIWGSLDGYFRNTTNLLYEYDVPLTGGNVSAKKWDNYGQIHNYGVEFSLNGIIRKTRDLNWTAGLNAAWNRNRVVRITGEQYGEKDADDNHIAAYQNTGYISSGDGETGNYVMRLVEGEAVGNYYGFKYAGVKDTGEWVFETPAGGYTTDPTDADKQVLGNAFPLVTLGFYTTVNYKNFDLGLNFRGQIGGLLFNETRYFYENTRGTENVLLSSFSGEAEKLTHWIDNPGSTKASLRRFSDFYLEDASYLKLNDLTFGWTPALKGNVSEYIKTLRVYINAQNLFTLTRYQGHDPSTVSMSGLAPGFDGRSYYPTQRTVSLGVNLNF